MTEEEKNEAIHSLWLANRDWILRDNNVARKGFIRLQLPRPTGPAVYSGTIKDVGQPMFSYATFNVHRKIIGGRTEIMVTCQGRTLEKSGGWI